MKQALAVPRDSQLLAKQILMDHRIEMSFLLATVINKPGKLNDKESKAMYAHIKSAADLIHRMQGWGDAREMILSHQGSLPISLNNHL